MTIELTEEQLFNKTLADNSPAGFSQFYHICVEATGGPYKGRYYWLNDGFFEIEFGRNDIIIRGKQLNEELLYSSIRQGYTSLVRIPKTKFTSCYKTEILF